MTPKEQALAELRKSERQDLVHRILTQRYLFKWGSFEVTRNENTIKIQWEFDRNPQNYELWGIVREIDYLPDADNLRGAMIVKPIRGDGKVNVTLPEGLSYHTIFRIFDKQYSHLTEVPDDIVVAQEVHFQVSIPLSSAKKQFLEKLASFDADDITIRDRVTRLLKRREMFDELFKNGIAEIEAKGLPEKEKQNRVEELKEEIERIKDEMGM